jgi:hypothetical protein
MKNAENFSIECFLIFHGIIQNDSFATNQNNLLIFSETNSKGNIILLLLNDML